MEQAYSGTCYDYVYIEDPSGNTILDRRCHTDNPGTITVPAGGMVVHFKTDTDTIRRGFLATIESKHTCTQAYFAQISIGDQSNLTPLFFHAPG